MTGSEFFFDTNAFIAWWKRDVSFQNTQYSKGNKSISVVSIGELLIGSKNSIRRDENLLDMKKRLESFRILASDLETAEYYSDIALSLRRKGRQIPDNDVWIAALAMQHGLTLVSRDSHFDEIDGLDVVSW